MIVKFKTGAPSYGLGYLEGDIADLKKVKTRVLTTLLDAQGNPRGQDWRDQEIDIDLLVEKGICVQASEDEISKYKEAIKAEAAAKAK